MIYCTVLLFALSSVLCGGWANEMMTHGVQIAAFRSLFYVFVVVGALVAFGPLLPSVPQLVAARYRGRRRYDELVSDYSNRFHERWFSGERRDELLGTSDAPSLADLGGVYRETVEKTVPFLFGSRDLLVLLVVSQLPAIPLVLMQLPAREVLARVLKLVTGGIG